MSLELIERFLVEYVPPNAKNPVHNVFRELKRHPHRTVVLGFDSIREEVSKLGSPEEQAAINGLVLGVALFYGVQANPSVVSMLEEYLQKKSLNRGENVIDFLQAQIGRKK